MYVVMLITTADEIFKCAQNNSYLFVLVLVLHMNFNTNLHTDIVVNMIKSFSKECCLNAYKL